MIHQKKISGRRYFNIRVIPFHNLYRFAKELNEGDIVGYSKVKLASLFDPLDARARVFVLGGETAGVGAAVRELADESLRIPMANGVESMNVAVTAALVAFRARLAH